ncbi:sensory box histidine kinase/response regulator [Plesiocystis pacifica SIR-1]|uniref:histidine kinase n=1 Tax=Plesiocystis pacifica SIR-1 TaxID=391625 RepID=A6GHE5_9BACT|nr:PAS domain-containing sensor histidine kinase [Plesiocystis pacifica]EDM74709.1 sensory box histidine kinase/response regulator [Plesiocystis pacifica SIR-1]
MANLEDMSREQLIAELVAARRQIADLREDPSAERAPALDPQDARSVLENLLEHLPDYLYFKDRERRFVLASQRFCQLFDCQLADIIGKTDEELFPPEVAARSVADDIRVIETGEALIGQIEGSANTGWVLTSKLPWRDAAGEVIGLFGLSRDINELKTAQDKLRDSERSLSVAQSIASLGHWKLDLGTQRVRVSDELARLLAPLEFDSEIDLEVFKALLASSPTSDHLDAAVEDKSPWSDQFQIRGVGGELRNFRTAGQAIIDDSGGVNSVIGVVQDITVQVRAAEQRRALEAQLQRAQQLESLGVLASGIAHDFNNLLVAMYGNMDLAMLDLDEDSEVIEYISEAKAAARQAAELVDQMLTYAGQGKASSEQVNLNQLVRDMTSLLESSTTKKTQLRMNLCPEPWSIRCDSSQLRQIILNLVTNAGEAIGADAGTVLVETELTHHDRASLTALRPSQPLKPGPYMVLTISDTGPGMDELTQTRAFDPFFTTKPTGSGLGLSAVHGIVIGRGGAVLLDSELGRGTRVRCLFPAGSPMEDAAPDTDDDAVWRGSGTILVIDDEDAVRSLAIRALERLGFRVLSANNGAVGVELFAAHRAQLNCVLLDLKMPVMDGEETFAALHRLDPTIPVILCSGFVEHESTRAMTRAGLAGFLQKPYTIEALGQTLHEVLG